MLVRARLDAAPVLLDDDAHLRPRRARVRRSLGVLLLALTLGACAAEGPGPDPDADEGGSDDGADGADGADGSGDGADGGDDDAPLSGDLADALWLGSEVVFVTGESGATLLGSPDDFSAFMSDYDRGIRILTTAPTTEGDYLVDAASYALDWEDAWLADWNAQATQLADALEGMNLELPDPIYIVAANNGLEFGFAHTRGAAIVLPRSILSNYTATQRLDLLAHELFHVASRNDAVTRDATYALLGFDPIDPLPTPSDYEDQRLTNPDAFSLAHAAELEGPDGAMSGAPFLYGAATLDQVVNQGRFGVEVLVIDAETQDVLPASDTNYSALVSINTSYDLHPEEALADNFAILAAQQVGEAGDAPDQDFIELLDQALTE